MLYESQVQWTQKATRDWEARSYIEIGNDPDEPWSRHLVSPLLNPVAIPYIIPFLKPHLKEFRLYVNICK